MRIYIIEDDPSVIQVLRRIVEEQGLGEVCGDTISAMPPLEQILAAKPDLILVDFSHLNLTPCHSVISNLAYAAHGGDVVMNMARGQVIYQDGEFFTIDIERVKREVADYALPRLFGNQ